MFEVDLNNGVFREIDLDKSVFCAICGNEIRGVPCSFDIETGRIDVHISGYAFCRKCKRDFEKWASGKIAQYEKQLAREFLNEIKAKYANGVTDEILDEWLGVRNLTKS